MNPLAAYCVINAVGCLLAVAILRDRPRQPTPRIRLTPPTVDVAEPEPLADWITEPGPAAWSAGRIRRTNDLPATTWPDPPPARHVVQPQYRHERMASIDASLPDRRYWTARVPVVVEPDPATIELEAAA